MEGSAKRVSARSRHPGARALASHDLPGLDTASWKENIAQIIFRRKWSLIKENLSVVGSGSTFREKIYIAQQREEEDDYYTL